MNALTGDILSEQATVVGPSISVASAPEDLARQSAKTRQAAAEEAFKNYLALIEKLFGTDAKKLADTKTSFAAFNKLSARPVSEGNVLKGFYLDNPETKTSIAITPEKISFVSNDKKFKDFTMDDAMRMAIVASQDPILLQKGIKIDGSAAQKRMLQQAIKAVNANLPEGAPKLNITNPVSRVRAFLSPRADFNGLMQKGLSGLAFADASAPAQGPNRTASPTPDAPTAREIAGVGIKLNVAGTSVPSAASPDTAKADDKSKRMLDGLTRKLEASDQNMLKSQDFLYERRGSNKGHNVYKVSDVASDSKTGRAINIDTYYVFKDNKPQAILSVADNKVMAIHPDIHLKNPPVIKVTKPEVTATFEHVEKPPVFNMAYGPQILVGEFSGPSNASKPVDHDAAVRDSIARAKVAVEGPKLSGP